MEVDDASQQSGLAGIDEQALLSDPTAVALIHDALEQVAKGALSAASEFVDGDAIDDDDDAS
jgi:hypothetical protein